MRRGMAVVWMGVMILFGSTAPSGAASEVEVLSTTGARLGVSHLLVKEAGGEREVTVVSHEGRALARVVVRPGPGTAISIEVETTDGRRGDLLYDPTLASLELMDPQLGMTARGRIDPRVLERLETISRDRPIPAEISAEISGLLGPDGTPWLVDPGFEVLRVESFDLFSYGLMAYVEPQRDVTVPEARDRRSCGDFAPRAGGGGSGPYDCPYEGCNDFLCFGFAIEDSESQCCWLAQRSAEDGACCWTIDCIGCCCYMPCDAACLWDDYVCMCSLRAYTCDFGSHG